MAHARQQIREAAATAVTSLTTTAARVYQSRVYPFAAANLPGLAVFSSLETLDEDADAPDTKEYRILELVIEARAKSAADVDDTLDTICAEVEVALYADQTLGALSKTLQLKTTEIAFSGELDQEVGLAKMTFEIMYRVDATDPTTIIA